jgi:glutamate-1-semialdehyde 2,1-aminomutase
MTQSEELFARAQRLIPGGVNSPVRAFKAVGGTPLFIRKAEAARMWDADGKGYIDFMGSWGPLILGHAHPSVIEAITQAAVRGTSYGAPCAAEVELADRVVRLVPSIQKVRFVSSGTEATMSALRLARGFTGRRKILKFEGCYHATRTLLVAAAREWPLGIPGSPGVPEGTVADTLTAPFNDLGAVESRGGARRDLAAIIVDPWPEIWASSSSRRLSAGLRDLATRAGAPHLRRSHDRLPPRGGAQVLYGVKPDPCLGKIIGGGCSWAPTAGGGHHGARRPQRPRLPGGHVVRQPRHGRRLRDPRPAAALGHVHAPGDAVRACTPACWARDEADVKVTINRVGSMITLFFTPGPVHDYASAKTSDTALFARFFHELLARGIYFPPAQYEAAFVSLAHTESDIDTTVRAAGEIFRELRA